MGRHKSSQPIPVPSHRGHVSQLCAMNAATFPGFDVLDDVKGCIETCCKTFYQVHLTGFIGNSSPRSAHVVDHTPVFIPHVQAVVVVGTVYGIRYRLFIAKGYVLVFAVNQCGIPAHPVPPQGQGRER